MNKQTILLATIVAAVALPAVTLPAMAADKPWVTLFDGKSLDGWIQKNGTAPYEVKDGAIVGTTAKGSPNSFLCTAKDYGDFELEFEVFLHDPQLNSGVQIRSKTKEAQGGAKYGRVNGPQVEIEASGAKGAESGYVYGEAAGGWMSQKRTPRKVFKDGEWNKYRVLAKGPRIQTWINGTAVEDLTHEKAYETHPKGFIGLQVHGIGKRAGPYRVAWRKIRIRELD